MVQGHRGLEKRKEKEMTPGHKLLMGEFRMMMDYDKWGTTMEWWFAVAEFLYHNEPGMIPGSWEFRDSPLHTPPFSPDDDGDMVSAMIWELYDNEQITLEDALSFGRTITRYAALLKRSGKDY